MGRPATIGAVARGGYGPCLYTQEYEDGAPPQWPAPGKDLAPGCVAIVFMEDCIVVGAVERVKPISDGTNPLFGEHLVTKGGLFARRRWRDEPGGWKHTHGADYFVTHLIHCTRWSDAHEGAGPEVPWGWWTPAPHPDDLRGWRL